MNKIILIGGDHHNGLGLVRSFGINGLRPYGIIITHEKSFVAMSKYWKKTWTVDSEHEALDLLLNHFSGEEEKPVVIPCSDGMAAEIDLNLDRLSPYFILPSLGGKQGAIVELMDKQKQIEFLKKYDLPMAKSWTISLPYNGDISEFVFPCICKPVCSFEGTKLDIKKCDSPDVLKTYLKDLAVKGYKRIMIQEYIFFEREIDFVGSCDDDSSCLVVNKNRLWPTGGGGSSSFVQIIDEAEINVVCECLLNALHGENYFGMFDIELFKVGNRVLINEINWRNTGISFLSLTTCVHWAVIWYMNAIGRDASNMKHFSHDTSQFAMNEALDLRHVLFGHLPFKTWFRDFRRAGSYALWYRKDLKPTLYRYAYLAKELFGKRRHG